ncbi:hypothetical protein ACIBQ1_45960 [Nonomuraea sp. NPDC050153]|uniref:hypothetical protein n=1 Tax=Nonomuraea sp. NPDC050153 TaxID=3364359 RepID=UPI00379D68A5
MTPGPLRGRGCGTPRTSGRGSGCAGWPGRAARGPDHGGSAKRERIAGHGTLLVVSHRQAALERADQIVVLDRGRVAGRGRLGELLESCPEMRRLWSAERIAEAEERTGD